MEISLSQTSEKGVKLEFSHFSAKPGPKPFSRSTQVSVEFIMLINVKMPTIVVILTFISMINTTPEGMKVSKPLLLSILVFIS